MYLLPPKAFYPVAIRTWGEFEEFTVEIILDDFKHFIYDSRSKFDSSGLYLGVPVLQALVHN